jgi:Cu+-exporting ATPase
LPQHSKNIKLSVGIAGMHCANCAVNLEKGLGGLPGVKSVNVNYASEKALLEYDPAETDLKRIGRAVSQIGFRIVTNRTTFPVRGMHCAACVARVEKALAEVPGVVSANVNLASEQAVVEYGEGVALADLRQAIRDAGFEPGSVAEAPEDVTAVAARQTRALRNKLIAAAVLGGIGMVLSLTPSFAGKPYLLWALATPVQFWAGLGFYKGAWGALKHKTTDKNTLIASAPRAAYFYSVVADIISRSLYQRRHRAQPVLRYVVDDNRADTAGALLGSQG